jgi:hypothetical protein
MAWPVEAGAVLTSIAPSRRSRRARTGQRPGRVLLSDPTAQPIALPDGGAWPTVRSRRRTRDREPGGRTYTRGIAMIKGESGSVEAGGGGRAVYHGAFRGALRIYNTAEYRFYRTDDGSAPDPDSDAPYATASSLPATPAVDFADGTWNVTVTYFNGVLESSPLAIGPAGETYLTLVIDSGEETEAAPNGPITWRINEEVAAGTTDGTLSVIAMLYVDTDAPADEVGVWVATGASVPSGDGAPDYSTSVPSNSMGVVSIVVPMTDYALGTTVNVGVRVGWTPDGGSRLWSDLELSAIVVGSRPSAPISASQVPAGEPYAE